MLNSTRLPQRRLRLLTGITWASILIALPALGEDPSSVVELKAAAYDAQQAAAEAQAAAAQAQIQAAQAQAALEQANQTPPAPAPVSAAPPAAPPQPAPVAAAPVVVIQTPAPAPVPVAPAAPPPPPPAPVVAAEPAATEAPPAPEEPPVTREELQRAIEKAEQAAAAARRAQEELDAYKEERRNRYARNGLTMSAGAFWAPHLFDTAEGVDIDASVGLSGGLGYRVHPHFSIETSFIWVDGFAIDDPLVNGTWDDLQMWSVLAGGKFYMLTGKVQPYLGIGFGAAGGKSTFRDTSGGSDIEFKEVGGVISFNGGIELYVSESLAIGGDAAVYLPGGDLSGLDFATIGAKLIYRF